MHKVLNLIVIPGVIRVPHPLLSQLILIIILGAIALLMVILLRRRRWPGDPMSVNEEDVEEPSSCPALVKDGMLLPSTLVPGHCICQETIQLYLHHNIRRGWLWALDILHPSLP